MKKTWIQYWALTLATLMALTTAPALAAPKVAVSIVPIHSLVAGVMHGVAEPTLLIPVGASPHNYALKPSDARTLQAADLIVWVGEGLETFLEKPLASLAGKARLVEIAEIDGLTLYEVREGGAFDGHAPNHGHKHSHAKKGAAKKPHDHDDDMHLWLDPDNAKIIVTNIATELSTLDAANAQRYSENARAMLDRITALDQGIKTRLASVQDRPYIVFHDAYQYFERHFGTKIVGSITVSPDQAPGAKRVSQLRERLRTAAVVCVFREPQFPAPVVDTLVSGTNVKVGVLDPEGADLTPGPDAYFTLMDRMADSLANCLGPAS
jgi:zinc transport system substrate-binding protein